MTKNSLSWVILAGGRASRMGGNDKGLLSLNDKTLIEIILDKIHQQTETVTINANRNIDAYRKFAPVVSDKIPGFQGPLAGIHAALSDCNTQWVGFTPCDTPNIPHDLVKRLTQSLDNHVDLYVAHDGKRLQPVFSVWNRNVLTKLEPFLKTDNRKIVLLFDHCTVEYVDFSDIPQTFVNLNTPQELKSYLSSSKAAGI